MKCKRITLALSVILASLSPNQIQADDASFLSDGERKILKRLGGKVIGDGMIELGGVGVEVETKILSFPAKLNMTSGPIEVLVCTPRGRTHESLLESEIDPLKLQAALILSGARNGPLTDADGMIRGDAFRIKVRIDGEKPIPIEEWIIDERTHTNLPETEWIFVGSNFHPQKGCLATLKGNLIDINSMDLDTILTFPSGISHTNNVFTIDVAKLSAHASEKEEMKVPTTAVTVFLIPVESEAKSKRTPPSDAEAGQKTNP